MSDMPLWTPSPERAAASQVMAFMAEVNRRHGSELGSALKTYRELHAWSVAHPDAFWNDVWDFCGVKGEKGSRLMDGDAMPGAKFFPDARLNFAENLLAHPGKGDAIVFRGEDKVQKRLSWDELNALVSRLQQALEGRGRRAGRPRRRHDAEPAGNHRRDARGDLARRDLVVLLAGFRRARRARSLWPDRAQGVRRGRWLLVQRQGAFARRQAQGHRPATAHREDGGDRSVSQRSRRGGEGFAECRHARCIPETLSTEAAHLRAPAVQSSGFHSLFVGHHGRAEMHRAWRRRHAPSTPERASPAIRHPRRRPRVLFHHLRLDDVELAGLRPSAAARR